jgi:hypothetical protein
MERPAQQKEKSSFTHEPQRRILFRRNHPKDTYSKLAISESSAAFGGRVTDSGCVASGSSTRLSKSMNVGFCVSM